MLAFRIILGLIYKSWQFLSFKMLIEKNQKVGHDRSMFYLREGSTITKYNFKISRMTKKLKTQLKILKGEELQKHFKLL